MDKEDARKQSLEQLHERRKQVVRLHKRKLGIMQIVELSGLSYPTVRNTIKLFEQAAGSPSNRRHVATKHGEGRRLSADQEAAIRRIICDSRPEQLKMDFYLWSRAAVGELIRREYGIELGVRTVGKWLKRWGSHHKSPSRKPMSSAPKRYGNGWTNTIRPSAYSCRRRRGNPLGGRNRAGEYRCTRP
ncbi:MAG: winged helix-turn-helix domain-containing protein [Chitinivorax sp.]